MSDLLPPHVPRLLTDAPPWPVTPVPSPEEARAELTALQASIASRPWTRMNLDQARSRGNSLALQALEVLSTPGADLPTDLLELAAVFGVLQFAHWQALGNDRQPQELLPIIAALRGAARLIELAEPASDLLARHQQFGPQSAVLGDVRLQYYSRHVQAVYLGASSEEQQRMREAVRIAGDGASPEFCAFLARAVDDRDAVARILAAHPAHVDAREFVDCTGDVAFILQTLGEAGGTQFLWAVPLWPHTLGLEASLRVFEKIVPGLDEWQIATVWKGLRQILSVQSARLAIGHLDTPGVRDEIPGWLREHPRVALEALASVEPFTLAARALLFDLATRDPDLARRIPGSAVARQRIASCLLPDDRGEFAANADLPLVLRDPPWRRKNRVAPTFDAVALTPHHLPADFGWTEEERQQLLVDKLDTDRSPWPGAFAATYLLHQCSRERFDDALQNRRIDWSEGDWWLRSMLARDPDAVLARLIREDDEWLSDVLEILYTIGSTQQVPRLVEAYRLKSRQRRIRGWMLTWPRHAAFGLVPLAVAADATEDARELLRMLHAQASDAVEEALAHYGEEARRVAGQIIAVDPLTRLPKKKVPRSPRFIDRERLPPVVLRSGGTLSDAAVDTLIELCSLSEMNPPYAGFEQVAGACTPDSLAAFSWALAMQWLADGGGGKHSWMFRSLAHFGGEDAVWPVGEAAARWPSQKLGARALHGLAILEGIGNDEAIAMLYRIAQKGRTKRLKEDAGVRIANIAARRDLTEEELADRCTPTLGLDEPGSLVLDYGPRRFSVHFTEALVPFLRDEDGKLKKSAPRPRKGDDPDRAELAVARFKDLKKQAKAVSKEQIGRLQALMLGQRTLANDNFMRFFADHPLMTHLCQRLVWATFDPDGALAGTFFITAEHECVDAEEEPVELPATGRVGLPHPVQLPEALVATWSELFADYELLQPFPQLARPVARPTEEELGRSEINRWQGLTASTRSTQSLMGRGWRAIDYDGMWFSVLERDVGDGISARVTASPPVDRDKDQQHTLSSVHFLRGDNAVTSRDVPPIGFSEAITQVQARCR